VRPRDAFSSSDDESRFETVIMEGFRPLHDSFLIRRIDADERSPGGTIVPDVADKIRVAPRKPRAA
jgi:hypothetical protein